MGLTAQGILRFADDLFLHDLDICPCVPFRAAFGGKSCLTFRIDYPPGSRPNYVSMRSRAASKIESLQKGAGTKINAAFGSSALTASATLLNTGLFK